MHRAKLPPLHSIIQFVLRISFKCSYASFNDLRLRAHGNVFERFHLCFHAKTDANTNNLLQKLELIQYIENSFPWSV